MNNLDIIFSLLAYEGSKTNDPADAIKVDNRIQETTITSVSRQKLQIVDGTTDQVITLPDPSSEYLVILTDQDISMKLNGSSDAQDLAARGAGKKTLVVFLKSEITALTISNASGKTASVDIIVANK